MMLAETGICRNRGVADSGPFAGLGLFPPACMSGEVGGVGVEGDLGRAPFFLDRYPWPDRLLKAIQTPVGLQPIQEKAIPIKTWMCC